MKRALIPLIIIGLLVSGTLGLFLMDHMDSSSHIKCPFESAGIINCVLVQNPLDLATSHLNAFSKFFSAAPVSAFAALMSLAVLLAFALLVVPSYQFPKLRPARIKRYSAGRFIPLSDRDFIHWFALHENSPALN
ncbi:MAG: hypothetical protein A2941_01420 [Candidatus Yanofskybacteria bacterium RIFCSPLOWO2_01_FULL_49_17]|uniref:Uncharacterized protein n=1 Tax=Candidatus Yanofskybacteria bacterium RIFCSPLOWO2_01_FULL_49_17 TaxID=1802700 RepID=A0A1F8GQI4_9BACT|nr:MAG: hypothetical protein A2941_01420 [Candidatus Yanofskybacteria bacterium RIFCSPLOWO2_01_FULL_49_17]